MDLLKGKEIMVWTFMCLSIRKTMKSHEGRIKNLTGITQLTKPANV